MILFKMFRRVLLVLLILGTIGAVAAEMMAVRYAEKTLAAKAAEKDGLAREATADVSAPLLWGLVSRNTIDRIQFTTRHVQVGPLLADEVIAVLTDVHIDRARSLKQGEPIVDKIGRLDVTVILSQEAVSKVLGDGVSVEFAQGSAKLKALGQEVEGTFQVVDETFVEFVPKASLPRGFPRPRIDLTNVPFVSCIQQILIKPGFVTVTCSKDSPPPDFPPA